MRSYRCFRSCISIKTSLLSIKNFRLFSIYFLFTQSLYTDCKKLMKYFVLSKFWFCFNLCHILASLVTFRALYMRKIQIQLVPGQTNFSETPYVSEPLLMPFARNNRTLSPHFQFTPCRQADKISSFIPKYCFWLQRPPSSSLSYGGPVNDDVRSPGTPGPLSQPPASQQSLDASDPGEQIFFFFTCNPK